MHSPSKMQLAPWILSDRSSHAGVRLVRRNPGRPAPPGVALAPAGPWRCGGGGARLMTVKLPPLVPRTAAMRALLPILVALAPLPPAASGLARGPPRELVVQLAADAVASPGFAVRSTSALPVA